MKKFVLFFIGILTITVSFFVFTKFYFPNYFKNAILANLPFVKDFVQKDFETQTSITAVKNSSKLVTAKQQLDFINMMEGKDGRYVEISTYEVKAGIDFEKIYDGKYKIQILSSNKIKSNVIRKKADTSNAEFYTKSIKPVNIAFEQKAIDYSIELKILERAEKASKETLKKIVGRTSHKPASSKNQEANNESNNAYEIKNSNSKVELPYVPIILEISDDYLREKGIVQTLIQNGGRDVAIFESESDNWKIRIGDSGRRYDKSFDNFYRNVLYTNTNLTNVKNEKDNVELFRYFDPMYPKESEVLSYASDSYKTIFLLNDGRIYYIDADCDNEQTLLDKVSNINIYLATSLRKKSDSNKLKSQLEKEFKKYAENFSDIAESLRNNEDRIAFSEKFDRLLKSKTWNDLTTENKNKLCSDEKLFRLLCDIKNFGRFGYLNSVITTDDNELNSIAELLKKLSISTKDFESEAEREKSIKTAERFNELIRKEENTNLALHQYLESYFLQNAEKFNLSKNDITRYEDDLNSGEIFIASKVLVELKSDAERNKYFYNLFRSKLSQSDIKKDTSSKIDDKLKISIRGNLTFAYFDIPETEEMTDGEIFQQITKKNNGQEIDNAFILIFNQKAWDFGKLGSDNDIHALVFDASTLRIFTNIGSQNIVEKAGETISSIFKRNSPQPQFQYGDWKNLHVSKETLKIGTNNFGTTKVTEKGKIEYKMTNDYAQKSTIAAVIEELQTAYSSTDADFYRNSLCEKLEKNIQNYVYKKIFRPSPRLIIELGNDGRRRYNY